MERPSRIILNQNDPDYERNEAARQKYEDEHYDDEFEQENDDEATGER